MLFFLSFDRSKNENFIKILSEFLYVFFVWYFADEEIFTMDEDDYQR